jgi:hypothetical protein
LFTFLLVVVAGYWLFVLAGAIEVGSHPAGVDGDPGADPAESGLGGVLDTLGLGGVPVTVVLTVLVVVAWFVSLVGVTLLDTVIGPGAARVACSLLVLVGALVCAWLGARVVVGSLRRLLPDTAAPSRSDFVGRPCIVRTGRAGPDFGQAEVTAADGSSAVIQVRVAGPAPTDAGWAALIYDYDADGEFFWITPIDPTHSPTR